MKRYFNKEAFVEGASCTLFAIALFYQIVTKKYLLFVKPRMKLYLYFSAAVMIVWAISSFLRISVPQYKMRLNRFLVLIIPVIATFLPYTPIKASQVTISSPMQTNQSYDSTNTSSNRDISVSQEQQNTVNTKEIPDNTANTQTIPDTSQDVLSQTQSSTSINENPENVSMDEQRSEQESSQSQSSSAQKESTVNLSGLDAENKTITISDTEFYQWLLELGYYPEKYEEYTIHIHGTVYRDQFTKENEFAITRLLMNCCVADLANCGPICRYDNALELTQDTWVNVTGTYHYDNYEGIVLNVTAIENAEPAEEEYVYPVY